jgi:methionyl-tRNA formyltransferase
MRVGLFTARFLGEAVANAVAASGVEVVGRHHTASGWWGTAGVDLSDDVFAAKPDLVVSVLTDHIFTPEQIEGTPRGIVNLHPAPLPAYRGCNSYSHAIINDDREYGVSLHYVDAGIDTGPLIASRVFRIGLFETARTLHDTAQLEALRLFLDEWPDICAKRTVKAPQRGRAAYYPRSSLEPYRDLSHWPPHMRDRIRRGLTFPPFPMPKERV